MNKTVLIIDDDDMLRDALGRGLRADGFDVITAESAETGRDILGKITVDAIVLDRMMGGMDGLRFLQELRNAGNATPIIMLTAMSGPENAIAGLSAGADDYLAKPFQLRELILRLRRVIRTSTPAAQMPAGLMLIENEFFVTAPDGTPQLLGLSGEEKRLMLNLVTPVGNIVPAAAMTAKRLRAKLNGVLSHTDIITVRGQGYKLIDRHTGPTDDNRGTTI